MRESIIYSLSLFLVLLVFQNQWHVSRSFFSPTAGSFSRQVSGRSYRGAIVVHQSSTSLSEEPPIAKDTFLTAIRVLDAEIARQTGTPVPVLQKNLDYVMAKLKVTLSIEGNPGLDLTEAAGLVLVTAVEGNAIAAGIQPNDTIIQVSVTDTFRQDCPALSLDHMSIVMQTAVGHAIQEGTGTIDLVLNRLLPVEYMDERSSI
jgi:hypothetical protein